MLRTVVGDAAQTTYGFRAAVRLEAQPRPHRLSEVSESLARLLTVRQNGESKLGHVPCTCLYPSTALESALYLPVKRFLES